MRWTFLYLTVDQARGDTLMKPIFVALPAMLLSACCGLRGQTLAEVPPSPGDITCIPKEEFKARLRAAMANDLPALYDLRMHFLGCESDEETGLVFMEREAALGDAEARQALIDIYGARPQYRSRLQELERLWAREDKNLD